MFITTIRDFDLRKNTITKIQLYFVFYRSWHSVALCQFFF